MSSDSYKDEVLIALASDDNYFPGLFTTTTSIARTASLSVALTFHIIDGGIDEGKKDTLLKAVMRIHAKTNIKWYPLKLIGDTNFPGKMNYARLLFPDLLTDVDHVIYCDVDFLWMNDISKLWRLYDDRWVVCSTADADYTQKSEAEWLYSKGIKIDVSRYFCSGMMLMNLRRFRSLRLGERLASFIQKYPDVPLFDQTALNAILANIPNGIFMLPGEWQRLVTTMSDSDFDRPMVLHYSGLCPWATRRTIPDIVEFWIYATACLSGCRFCDVRNEYFTKSGYRQGRLLFRILSVVWPFHKIVVLMAKIARGDMFARYLGAILRRIKCPINNIVSIFGQR